jgi:DNA-binding IclR family transcriptional regulator
MYEHHVAVEQPAGQPELITGDFEIAAAVFHSSGMCPFVVNIVLPEAVVDRTADWEELRPCR